MVQVASVQAAAEDALFPLQEVFCVLVKKNFSVRVFMGSLSCCQSTKGTKEMVKTHRVPLCGERVSADIPAGRMTCLTEEFVLAKRGSVAAV